MNKKVIVIAGATSMIGRACANILSSEDTIVVLLGRNEEKLKQVARAVGNGTEGYITDFCSEDSINGNLEKIIKKHLWIDAVIYNVAVYPWKKIEELSLEEWQESMASNLNSAFLLSKGIISSLKKQRHGKIVYVSSIAGEQIGLPYMSAYAASKAGLNGLMRTCAIELAPFNIQVNAISPGKIYDPALLTEKEIKAKLRPIPLRRFVDPKDIAYMVEFLISEKANAITGQNFIVDGGQSILGEENHIGDGA